MSFWYDSEGIAKAVEGGEEFMAIQKAAVDWLAALEEARRAALPVEPLPEGNFETLEEAKAYLDEQRAAGRFPLRFDDGSGTFPYTIKISSPYNGYQEVWTTAVVDEDPNPPLHVHMEGQG